MSEKRGTNARPRHKRSRSCSRASTQGSDVVLIRGISQDGQAMAVLRAREDRVEAGVVRAMKEGEAPQGELVKLTPRPELPLLCDVQVEVPEGTVNAAGGTDRSGARTSHSGPAQVATDSYRANWDAIWNKPSKKNPLPN